MAGTAGSIKAGRAYVEFFTDTTRFSAGLNTVQTRLRKISASIALTGASISAIGTAGAAGFLPMIKAAGDFESTLALFGSVFKGNTRSVRDWSAATAKALGRSQAELMAFAADAGGVLANFGFDESQVVTMSQSLTQLAVDVASLQNISDKDAFGKLLSGITGDANALKAIGVIANDAALDLELLASGLDPKNATEAQKVFARYTLTIKQTSDAQGDARRNSGTFTNQLKKLQSQVADLYIAIGRPLQSALANVMKAFEQTANSIVRLVTENPKAVSSFAKIAVAVAGVGAALVGLAALFAGAAVVLRTIVAPFMAISTAVGLLMPLLSALVSPIGAVIAALAVLAISFKQYLGNLEPLFKWFRDQFFTVVDAATEAVAAIMAALQRGDFGAAAEVALAGLNLAWVNAISGLQVRWAGFTGFFKESFTKAAYALPVIFVGVVAIIKKLWIDLSSFISKTLSGIMGFFQDVIRLKEFYSAYAQLADLRDKGAMSNEEFKSRLDALKASYKQDLENAKRDAANDVASVDQKAEKEKAEVNAQGTAELGNLKSQLESELAAIAADGALAAEDAQKRIDAAKARYEDALKQAKGDGVKAPEGVPPPDLKTTSPKDALEELRKQIMSAGEVTGKAAATGSGGVFGAQAAELAFGVGGTLEDLTRQQLKEQRRQLRQDEVQWKAMMNQLKRLSWEFR